MRGNSLIKLLLSAAAVLLLTGGAFANTAGNCTFNATTNTLIVTEGPESSADHGGIDCNLKDVSSGLYSPGHNQFFDLTEQGASKFPCSDFVDVTNNHVSLISDPRVPDQGLPCTPNRTKVPEVAVGKLGFGANLGNILALCNGGRLTGGGKCTGTSIPVDLIVISDQSSTAVVPEPGTMTLLASGLIGIGGLVRRRYAKR